MIFQQGWTIDVYQGMSSFWSSSFQSQAYSGKNTTCLNCHQMHCNIIQESFDVFKGRF